MDDADDDKRGKLPKKTVRMPSAVDHATIRDLAPPWQFGDTDATEPGTGRPPPQDVAAASLAERAASEGPASAPAARAADSMRETQTDLEIVEPPKTVFQTGTEFRGRYVIGALLGSGGFGEVYEARDRRTGQDVAVKVVLRGSAGRREVITRFKREGKYLQQLSDVPNIVRVLEVVDDDPTVGVCIIMERLRGKTLEQLVKKENGRLGVGAALEIVARIAEAMQPVHNLGIFHRDLKPSNIVLEKTPSGEDRIVVLDLGIGKQQSAPTITSQSAMLGTAHYISPEQVGRGEIGRASDIYSLACMLFELIEGEWIYHERERRNPTANAVAQCGWHLFFSFPLPRRIPVVVWNILARALEKEKSLRYATMADFAKALRRVESDLHAGRLTRAELTPACESDGARPPPEPVKQLDESTPIPDLAPFEARPGAVLDVPSLVVVGGPQRLLGKRYGIGRDLTIGRVLPSDMKGEEAPLAFDVGSISKHHCKLQAKYEGFVRCVYQIEDLESRHGTFLGGRRTPEGIIQPGAQIGIADLLLELRAPDVKAEGPSVQGTVGFRAEAKIKLETPSPSPAAPLSAAEMARIRQRVDRSAKEGRAPSVSAQDLSRFIQQQFAEGPKIARSADAEPRRAHPRRPALPMRSIAIVLAAMLVVIAAGLLAFWRLGLLGDVHHSRGADQGAPP